LSKKLLSLEEYYPWYKQDNKCYPWERQYLNWEFLSYEKKRINDLQKWYKKFIRTPQLSELDKATFYCVPIELSSTWKASLAEYGNQRYIGLSALFNSSQILIIGVLAYSDRKPSQYSLIEINKSKRLNFYNKRLNKILPGIFIEEWESLNSDQIYVDVPYERKIIKKILNETLVHDDNISKSFQAPIISAPYVYGSLGGISLSSLSNNSSFGKELIQTIQLMMPPEYRTLLPPEQVYKGKKFLLTENVKFHLAERPMNSDNLLSGIISKKYEKLNNELERRKRFVGEYSIFSTIVPDAGTKSKIIKTLIKQFTDCEANIPYDLDDFIYADVDLTNLINAIDENIWLEVFNARQYKPEISDNKIKEINKITLKLKDDFDVLFSDIIKSEEDRKYFIKTSISKNKDNLKRLAQSFARADEKNKLQSEYLEEARDLIVDNITHLIYKTPYTSTLFDFYNKPTITSGNRYSVVETELISHPLSSNIEIFDAIKSTNLFHDLYDLQEFLDWLHNKGYVIVDGRNRYSWI